MLCVPELFNFKPCTGFSKVNTALTYIPYYGLYAALCIIALYSYQNRLIQKAIVEISIAIPYIGILFFMQKLDGGKPMRAVFPAVSSWPSALGIYPAGSSVDEFATFFKSNIDSWSTVIETIGLAID